MYTAKVMENVFCKRLKELRKDAHLSQGALAEKIGATQKAIDFWEKGINEPKASYIVELSRFFEVSTDYLLGLED